MLQKSQIGAYRYKEDVLNAKKGKVFVAPDGREYGLDWLKEGRKYIIVIVFKENRMQVTERDYNSTPIDVLLDVMKNEII